MGYIWAAILGMERAGQLRSAAYQPLRGNSELFSSFADTHLQKLFIGRRVTVERALALGRQKGAPNARWR